jgi:hypothetical protein
MREKHLTNLERKNRIKSLKLTKISMFKDEEVFLIHLPLFSLDQDHWKRS